MTKNHPITPPPELVREWAKICSPYEVPADHIATQAARWGWDQRGAANQAELQEAREEELEACCEWLKTIAMTKPWDTVAQLALELRDARRPKPPSLAEQALTVLERTMVLLMPVTGPEKIKQLDTIRTALERLQALEQVSNGN